MAKGGRVQHWKHGWIPISPEAKAWVAGGKKGPRPGGGKAEPTGPKLAYKPSVDYYPFNRITTFKRAPEPPGDKLMAAMKNGGFTYDPRKGGLIKVGKVDGVAVARPGTEQIVGRGDISREAFASSVADVIEKHGEAFGSGGAMLGGWYSQDRDAYMVEVTDIFPDRETAILEGKRRNQEGVFDLKTGEFIPTGGTGDSHPEHAGMDLTMAARTQPDPGPMTIGGTSFAGATSTGFLDPDSNLIHASTGPGQAFWPEGVPAIKDVSVRNAAEGRRLAEAWAASGNVLDKYSAQEPTVTPRLVRQAAESGGYMQGLEYRLKTRDSLARKLYEKAPQKGLTPDQYAGQIGDALRYTMVTPPDSLSSAAQQVIDSYRRQGYEVDVGNTWGDPNASYRGINVNITKNGQTFELQFHTPESFDVKMAQHDLYDIARSSKYTAAQRAEAEAKMRANVSRLAFPPGIIGVK